MSKEKKKVVKTKAIKKKGEIKIVKKYKLSASHNKSFAIMARNGTVWFGPRTCKDQMMNAFRRAIRDRSKSNKCPSLTSPEFAYWTNAKTVERNAEKFRRMMNRLERKIGIKGRTSVVLPDSKGKKTSAFIVRAPKWWIKSPISLSAYFIFLNCCPYMKMREKFEKFFARMVEKGKHKEARYLRQSLLTGTMGAFLDGTLPSLNKRGRSAWRGYQYGEGLLSHALPTDFRVKKELEKLDIKSE